MLVSRYSLLTITTAQCARNKLSSPTRRSSIAPRGLAELFSTSWPEYLADTSLSSCRRRDSIPTPPPRDPEVSAPFHKANRPDSSMCDYLSASLPDPLPRLKPTAITGIKEARIPPKFHDGAADLDPTEWKPAEPAIEGYESPPQTGTSTPIFNSGYASPFGGSSASIVSSWKPKLLHRPNSAASNYLGQFHRSSDSLTSTKRRSARATNSLTSRANPGLSHSPTISSNGSEGSLGGTPYELVIRPRAVSRPTTAVTTSPTKKEGVEISYEKQSIPTVIDPHLRSASGSLKELLTGAKKTAAAM